MKTRLRPYQEEAVRRALKHDGFALYMEQRTGKTLTALAIVDARKDVHKVLVISPKKAIPVWQAEIDKHFRREDVEFWLVNYEYCNSPVKNKKERKKLFQSRKRELLLYKADMVILDEMHRIKGRATQVSRLCHALGRVTPYRLGLTGTPVAQGIQDVYSQFKFVDPNLYPEKWSEFQATYLIMGGYMGRQIIGNRNIDQFNEVFHSRSFRVTLREVSEHSPRLRHINVTFPLKKKEMYDILKKQLILEVKGKEVQTPNILTLIQKLQQITGGHVIMSDGTVEKVGSEKLDKLKELLTTLNRVVIFAKFLHEIEAIGELLTAMGRTYQVVRGGKGYTGKFTEDAVILQIQSGIAIDLSASDTAIYYSPDYSYTNFEQSKSRILSHGTRKATYYYLIAENTVDVDIYNALRTKTNVAKYVCDLYRGLQMNRSIVL